MKINNLPGQPGGAAGDEMLSIRPHEAEIFVFYCGALLRADGLTYIRITDSTRKGNYNIINIVPINPSVMVGGSRLQRLC